MRHCAASPVADAGPCVQNADQRFEQLFESTAEALVLCSRKGLILAVNAEASKMCGKPAAALIGRNMLELIRNGTGTGAQADGQVQMQPGESLLKTGTGQLDSREGAGDHAGTRRMRRSGCCI